MVIRSDGSKDISLATEILLVIIRVKTIQHIIQCRIRILHKETAEGVNWLRLYTQNLLRRQPPFHEVQAIFLEREFEQLERLHHRWADLIPFCSVRLLCQREYTLTWH